MHQLILSLYRSKYQSSVGRELSECRLSVDQCLADTSVDTSAICRSILDRHGLQ